MRRHTKSFLLLFSCGAFVFLLRQLYSLQSGTPTKQFCSLDDKIFYYFKSNFSLFYLSKFEIEGVFYDDSYAISITHANVIERNGEKNYVIAGYARGSSIQINSINKYPLTTEQDELYFNVILREGKFVENMVSGLTFPFSASPDQMRFTTNPTTGESVYWVLTDVVLYCYTSTLRYVDFLEADVSPEYSHRPFRITMVQYNPVDNSMTVGGVATLDNGRNDITFVGFRAVRDVLRLPIHVDSSLEYVTAFVRYDLATTTPTLLQIMYSSKAMDVDQLTTLSKNQEYSILIDKDFYFSSNKIVISNMTHQTEFRQEYGKYGVLHFQSSSLLDAYNVQTDPELREVINGNAKQIASPVTKDIYLTTISTVDFSLRLRKIAHSTRSIEFTVQVSSELSDQDLVDLAMNPADGYQSIYIAFCGVDGTTSDTLFARCYLHLYSSNGTLLLSQFIASSRIIEKRNPRKKPDFFKIAIIDVSPKDGHVDVLLKGPQVKLYTGQLLAADPKDFNTYIMRLQSYCSCDMSNPINPMSTNRCLIPYCYGVDAMSPDVCFGAGLCVDANRCACKNGSYTGQQCNFKLCNGVPEYSPNVCSGRGTCVGVNKCLCTQGSGQFCETFRCFGQEASSPIACGGNGACVSKDTCICYANYTGLECDVPINVKSKMCGIGQYLDGEDKYSLLVTIPVNATGNDQYEEPIDMFMDNMHNRIYFLYKNRFTAFHQSDRNTRTIFISLSAQLQGITSDKDRIYVVSKIPCDLGASDNPNDEPCHMISTYSTSDYKFLRSKRSKSNPKEFVSNLLFSSISIETQLADEQIGVVRMAFSFVSRSSTFLKLFDDCPPMTSFADASYTVIVELSATSLQCLKIRSVLQMYGSTKQVDIPASQSVMVSVQGMGSVLVRIPYVSGNEDAGLWTRGFAADIDVKDIKVDSNADTYVLTKRGFSQDRRRFEILKMDIHGTIRRTISFFSFETNTSMSYVTHLHVDPYDNLIVSGLYMPEDNTTTTFSSFITKFDGVTGNVLWHVVNINIVVVQLSTLSSGNLWLLTEATPMTDIEFMGILLRTPTSTSNLFMAHVVTDGLCRSCPDGSIQSQSTAIGESSCTMCDAGTYASDSRDECLNCNVGQFSHSGSSSCKTCPIGFYTNGEGSSNCTACYFRITFKKGASHEDCIFATSVIVATGILFVVVCVLGNIISIMCCKYRAAKRNQRDEMEKALLASSINNYSTDSPVTSSTRPLLVLETSLTQIKYEELKKFKELATGGSGSIIFKAEWRKLHVAVKVFRAPIQFNQHETIEHFENELQLLASLHHQNMVQLYGYFINFPKMGIVLEYCANGNLKQYFTSLQPPPSLPGNNNSRQQASSTSILHETFVKFWKDYSKLDWKTKLNILTDVANGMNYLHKKGIIHRDLKSENILIDKSGNAKISDFGVSKFLQLDENSITNSTSSDAGIVLSEEDTTTASSSTATLSPRSAPSPSPSPLSAMTKQVGTGYFMAPEVTLGEQYTNKCDIFSFGIVMFEVLTCQKQHPYFYTTANRKLKALAKATAASQGSDYDSPIPSTPQDGKSEKTLPPPSSSTSTPAPTRARLTSVSFHCPNIELEVANNPTFRPELPLDFNWKEWTDSEKELTLVERFMELMRKCWQRDPGQRPSFDSIIEHLESLR